MASAGEKRQREEPSNEPDQPAEQETAKAEDDPQPAADAVDAEQAKPAGEAETASDDVIETGRLYFFYKPRVEVEQVKKMADVQRFYIVMEPLKPEGKKRLVPLPKKRLPDPARHERFFAFVEAVADDIKALTGELESKEYDTKTRGHRTQGAARAVGEAAYVLAKHKNGTRLAYKLEVPEKPGEAQQLFKIKEQASFVVSIKNPENKTTQPGIPQLEGEYSEPQRKRFKGYAWIPVERDLLDVQGAMLLLIGAREDPKEDLPQEALESLEEVYESDEEDIDAKAGKDQNKRKEVAAEKLKEAIEPAQETEALPVKPAVTGELV